VLHFVDSNSKIDWANVCNLVNSDRKNEMMFLMDNLKPVSAPVLEIGCNVGGLTVLLASHGLQVCALDPSKVMINAARNKIEDPEVLDRVTFKELSFIETEQLLGQQYGLIVVPANGFMSILDPKYQQKFLLNTSKLLAPNGRLILVNATPRLSYLMADPAVMYHHQDVFEEGIRKLILSIQTDFDDYTQVGENKVYAEFLNEEGIVTKKVGHNIKYRFTYVREMHNLLKLCGFTGIELYGRFDKTPHHRDSESMIWVAAT
jgi:SAM-dependent methyltransferase